MLPYNPYINPPAPVPLHITVNLLARSEFARLPRHYQAIQLDYETEIQALYREVRRRSGGPPSEALHEMIRKYIEARWQAVGLYERMTLMQDCNPYTDAILLATEN